MKSFCPICSKITNKTKVKRYLPYFMALTFTNIQIVRESDQLAIIIQAYSMLVDNLVLDKSTVLTSKNQKNLNANLTTTASKMLLEVANVEKLQPGLLVNVLPRTWAGESFSCSLKVSAVNVVMYVGINKLGGIAWILLSSEDTEGLYYDVKYVLDSKCEQRVPAAFVEQYKELDRTIRRSKHTKTSDHTERGAKTLYEEGSNTTTTNSNSSAEKARKRRSSGGESSNTPHKKSSNASTASRIVLLTSGISSSFHSTVDAFVKRFSSVIEVSSVTRFHSSVTHLVVAVDPDGVLKQRTMKYMQSLMCKPSSCIPFLLSDILIGLFSAGIWIVSTQWISDSLRNGTILVEEAFEVNQNSKAHIDFAPRRARLDVSSSSTSRHEVMEDIYISLTTEP